MADNYPDAEEVIKETCEILKAQGVGGLTKHILHDLNRWKEVKIKIAVTGNSGAGKSSLINALRGLPQGDKNAAKEGVKETTRKQALYTFPDNDRIELYDLPGVGTLSQPLKSYMQNMNFKQYDFVLIVSSQRFSENDAFIIKTLRSLGKPVYLVRSKISFDVENQKSTQTKDEVLKIIHDDCSLNLQTLSVKVDGVFLIDSHVHQDFDLEKLQMTLIHDAPITFQDTLVLTFVTMTEKIIRKKVKILKRRVLRVAFLAIASAVPGANYFMDEGVLKDEISFYQTELGLDDEALGKTCKDLAVDRTRLQEMIAFCDFVVYPEKAIEYINNINLDDSSPSFNNFIIGTTRALTGFVSTYPKICRGLLKIIEMLEKDSLMICENVFEKVNGSSFV